ncbi:hypothetical protein ACFFIF_08170 [Vagococcus entomophilus]|uniref:Uncharacterized protein n=1 Tax=Vagococcus entomophilus TaxID=1160095 RepID=A0A430AHD7_9ENTE|nr:hypothetical protein [Vagococcus entomophilus]RSU07264.1 hypothetical protein CBF30_08395 [Vagococcus entomophilus]
MWQAIGLSSNKVYMVSRQKRTIIAWLNQAFPSDSKRYPIYQEGDFYNILPEKIGLFHETIRDESEVK